jgi:penicillin amidase
MHVPEGLDAAAVSEADLGVLQLGSPAVQARRRSPPTPPAERANAGSNAWTVGPSRTATGRPILANDPHLGIGGFGPRHVAHLARRGST